MSHRNETLLSGRFGGDKKYQYTRLDAQAQNVKNSKVYVFGDDDIVDCDDDEVVEYEMDAIRPRKGRTEWSKNDCGDSPSYVERRITEGDTLSSLSLQYGCPVSELKRVNNLISDQDFYALTRVKIPVKQYSFLIDQIKEEDRQLDSETFLGPTTELNGGACYNSGDERVNGYDTDQDAATDLSDPETQKHVIREISINKSTRSQSREAKEFLKSMDKDLSKIMSTRRKDRNSLDEVISVLTNKSVHPLTNVSATSPEVKSSEWSLKWRTSFILLLIVAIGAPLVFGLHLIFNGRST